MNASLSEIKTVILAGGLGTRLSEETTLKPKPMVEIGGRPVLWHIMKIYSAYGCRMFHVACGYKSDLIKGYFANFPLANSDWNIHLGSGKMEVLSSESPDWIVGVHDTGMHTLTGGRLRRLKPFLTHTFMATYGDGLGTVDIDALIAFHRSHGRIATLTVARPPARFGSVEVENGKVVEFSEKAALREGWINAGFFVFEPAVMDYISGDDVSLETGVLARLCADGELFAYSHEGFWQPMDTLREKQYLESLWQSGSAPWKIWE